MEDRKKKGGRPAIENKKQFRINVRFDESEHNRVLHNAKIAGMSKSEWVRKSAILRKIVPRFTEEQLKAFRALTGASNNLNQLTRKAHQSGLIEVAQECKIRSITLTIVSINYCTMIAKIIEGRSFGGCVGYALKKDSEIIHVNGLRTDSAKTITQDFNFQRMLNPRLGKAVGHIILSWNTEDKNKLNNDIMLSAAKRYLSKLDIRDTQCLMVRHHDRQHDHIHIIFNRVNDHGKTISNSNQRYKSFKACKELNALYGFKQSEGKRNVNRGRLKGNDLTKYQIYDTVKAGIRHSKNWKELQNYIRYRGVEMQFKYRLGSDEVQGISFIKDEQTFRGSAIDRSLSFGQIDKALNSIDNSIELNQITGSYVSKDHSIDRNIGETLGHITSALFSNPEITPEQDDPLIKKRKKKENYGLKR